MGSQINIKLNKNCLGVIAKEKNISLPQQIKYNQGYGFYATLELNENEAIGVHKEFVFSNDVEFIVNTNLFEIECTLNIPVYLFFDRKEEMAKDTFLNSWKSISKERQCRLQIAECKYNDIESVKQLLSANKYEMYFIHHRIIPNRGD